MGREIVKRGHATLIAREWVLRSESVLTPPGLSIQAGRTFQAALGNFSSASVEKGQPFRGRVLKGQKLQRQTDQDISVGLTI